MEDHAGGRIKGLEECVDGVSRGDEVVVVVSRLARIEVKVNPLILVV